MLKNYNLYIVWNHSSVTMLKHFVYRWQLNINAKFQFPSMIHRRDIEHHNINIEMSLTVQKIIQA